MIQGTTDYAKQSDEAKQKQERERNKDNRNNPQDKPAGEAAAGAIETAVDKAGEFVGHAKEKVQEWAHTASDKVKEAATATGEMAVHAKDKAQEMATTAIHGAGDALHTAKDELTQAIRRYPIQSVLVSLALGYLVVKATSRS